MTPYGLLTKGVPTRSRAISKLVINKRRHRNLDHLVKAKRYHLPK